jgi:hypothetical protein
MHGDLTKPLKPYRSRRFLEWAKRQGGCCCICQESPATTQLHHYGPKGMGQKGSDLLIAQVCRGHHEALQGKRALAFRRNGDLESYVALLEDNVDLLAGYVVELEARKGSAS